MGSFFRYPGGKRKMMHLICDRVSEMSRGKDVREYREPFFGGGGVGLSLLSSVLFSVPDVWINDKDIGLVCLWTSVLQNPAALKDRVRAFTPSVAAFDEFQDLLRNTVPDLNDPDAVVRYGFAKLALYQISYSGLGLMSGGPLGGRDQSSKYPIDCRWSPKYLCKGIDETYAMLSGKVRGDRCANLDCTALLTGADERVVIYLDPPYYEKGGELYHCAFTEADHVRLRDELQKCDGTWLLSYDDHPRIRELYEGWATVEQTEGINYSITAKNGDGKKESRVKPELLISRRVL
jgi:DNA adenine methylase